MNEALTIGLFAACALSLVLSAGCLVWVVLFSGPASIRKVVDQCAYNVLKLGADFESVKAAFTQHKAEIAGIEEAIQGTLESVERKRKQIAGSASRLNVAQAEAVPQTREEIVNAARQRVYAV
jgi:hypothetical protein